jgi:hypothetical protein
VGSETGDAIANRSFINAVLKWGGCFETIYFDKDKKAYVRNICKEITNDN